MSSLCAAESALISHEPGAARIDENNMPESQVPVSEKSARKTLIMDLDETLVHSSFIMPDSYDYEVEVHFNGNPLTVYVQKRPGVDQFIRNVLAYDFDLFIFTASLPEYSVPVVQKLIPTFPASRILSRYHCRFVNGYWVKDISIFNRDLSSVILVDNSSISFALQPENGLCVSSWTGENSSDTELIGKTLPLLKACRDSVDVRRCLRAAL